MGSLIGHVVPGFGFFVIGLWHLINHIKLHAINPKSYTSTLWFPTSKIKYMELYFIMVGSSMSISMELFIGPHRHHPLDQDGTIPSIHLHNFEHANISLTFLTYAFFSIILDQHALPVKHGLANLLGGVAFANELFLFHFHSTDHMGVEGQYHRLLQIVIFTSLVTTLLGINYTKSFLNSFVRSISIMFQGIWLVVIGFMLWTPSLIPKGCFLNLEEGHKVVRCKEKESLERAKSLVNIQFSWYVVATMIFSITLYLIIIKMYHGEIQKIAMMDDEYEDDDFEAQNKADYMTGKTSKNFLDIGRSFVAMDMER